MTYWIDPMLITSRDMISIGATQILGGRQSVATFAEGAPRWTPLQAFPALIWAIHHHQGYWGQFLRS